MSSSAQPCLSFCRQAFCGGPSISKIWNRPFFVSCRGFWRLWHTCVLFCPGAGCNPAPNACFLSTSVCGQSPPAPGSLPAGWSHIADFPKWPHRMTCSPCRIYTPLLSGPRPTFACRQSRQGRRICYRFSSRFFRARVPAPRHKCAPVCATS